MQSVFIFLVGFILGCIFTKYLSKDEQKTKPKKRTLSYTERQKAKVKYNNDADRIREINLLSNTEGKFYRILQHEFNQHEIIIKNKRFFIIDKDNYPIAIFEYRDGIKPLKNRDIEDGIPIFIYKAILSTEAIKLNKSEILNK